MDGSLFNSLDPYAGDYHQDSIQGKGTSKAGYWNPSEAWSYSMNREDDYEENSEDELTMEYDNENTWKDIENNMSLTGIKIFKEDISCSLKKMILFQVII